MALSKSGNLYNRQNWEESDHPIICQTCAGENPYLRMTRERHGKECKICTRPFTVFRWCPGRGMRFKKTEICQSCSRMKNVCQTCLLDLEYGLPVQVRDAALNIQQDEMPKSDVGREFYVQKLENELANTDGTMPHGSLGKIRGTSEMLTKLARTTPYYKRNRPHICSFWVKGACKRGEECPYRHEKPTDPDDPLADQNIKDRYFGVNDPVADKLMKRYTDMVNGVDDDQSSAAGANGSKTSATNATTEYLAYQQPPPPPPDMSLPPPVLLPPPGAIAGNRRYAYPSQDPERLGSGNYKQKS